MLEYSVCVCGGFLRVLCSVPPTPEPRPAVTPWLFPVDRRSQLLRCSACGRFELWEEGQHATMPAVDPAELPDPEKRRL